MLLLLQWLLYTEAVNSLIVFPRPCTCTLLLLSLIAGAIGTFVFLAPITVVWGQSIVHDHMLLHYLLVPSLHAGGLMARVLVIASIRVGVWTILSLLMGVRRHQVPLVVTRVLVGG